jgi:hypothetical protein
MFLHLDVIEGTIAWYYGSLSGTLNNGLSSMFSPCLILMPSPQETPGKNLAPHSTHDPKKNICDFILKLVWDANENNMFM